MVGCPEAFTRAGAGPEWRETTTMPLTTRPASTAIVIRRSDAGSVPGPDVPTAGRERMSIGQARRAMAGSGGKWCQSPAWRDTPLTEGDGDGLTSASPVLISCCVTYMSTAG